MDLKSFYPGPEKDEAALGLLSILEMDQKGVSIKGKLLDAPLLFSNANHIM